MASSVLGEKVAKQLELIPLFNDTVSGRISDMALNVKEQLIEKVKASKYYSIQLDESTDVSNMAYLLTFIRFEDESVKEELLFCEPSLGRTTSKTFLKIRSVYEGVWHRMGKSVGICSDGARAMTGEHSGVVAQIKEVAPDAKFVHCSIH
jgi:hypothetical protein